MFLVLKIQNILYNKGLALVGMGKYAESLDCFYEIPGISRENSQKMVQKLRTQLVRGKISEAFLEVRKLSA